MLQHTSLNLSLDICSKIMATVIRPLGITTFYTLILNLLYTNHIILHTYLLYYHHNSNHVSEIPRRPLILFIGVCHKLYFCGIELSSINLLKFLCWKFWVGGVLPIRHFPWSLAAAVPCWGQKRERDCAKKPCHFLQKHKYLLLQGKSKEEACFAKMMLPCG